MKKVFVAMVFVALLVSSLIFAIQPKVLRELSNVSTMTSSVDGQYILAAGDDGCFIFMDLKNNPESSKRVFVSSSPVKGVSISEDKNYFAVATEDGLVKVYDLATQKEVKSYLNTGLNVVAVSLNPLSSKTPRMVAVLYEDGIVRVYNFLTASSKPVYQFKVSGKGLYFVDASTLAVVSDNAITLYAVNGEEKDSIELPGLTAYAPIVGTKLVLVGKENGEVSLVDLEALEEKKAWSVFDGSEISALAVSNYSKSERIFVAASKSSATLAKLNMSSLEISKVDTLELSEEDILAVVVDPLWDVRNQLTDSRLLKTYAYLGTTKKIYRAEVKYEGMRHVFKTVLSIDYKGHENAVKYIRVTADGRYMFTLDGETLRIWDLSDLNTIEVKTPYEDASAIKSFAIASNIGGKAYLVTTDGEEVLTLIVSSFENLLNGKDEFKVAQRFNAEYGTTVISVDLIQTGGKYFALAMLDNGKMIVQNLATGNKSVLGALSRKVLDMKTIYSTFETPTLEPYVVSAHEDGKVRFWRIAGDEPIAELSVGILEENPDIIAVSPNGKYIAVSTKGFVKVYTFRNLLDGKIKPVVSFEEVGVTSLAFMNDSVKLVLGTENGEVIVYNVESKAREQVLEAHPTSRILKVVVAGSRIVTSAEDKTVKIW